MPDTEITAEWNVDQLTGPDDAEAPAAGHCRVTFAARSDLGRVRENNEDKFDWWEPDDAATLSRRGRLYLVADGMGGHAAGQIASEMAVKAIGSAYYGSRSGGAEEALTRAIVKAHALVRETGEAIPSRSQMGCTIVALALVGNRAVIAWAGDSRAYLVRDGEARQLTEDHSWVMEQVRAGVMSREEAATSSYSNVITRCLGVSDSVQPETVTEIARAGDVFLLCSDGLTGPVAPPALAAAAGQAPSFACAELVRLANENGGPDNITAAILRIDSVEPDAGAPSEETAAEPKARRWTPFGRRDR